MDVSAVRPLWLGSDETDVRFQKTSFQYYGVQGVLQILKGESDVNSHPENDSELISHVG